MADLGTLEFVWGMEGPLFFVAAAVALVGFWKWFPLNRNRLLVAEANPGLGLVRAALLFAGLYFWWVLATAADGGIVGFYTGLYVALAFACLLVGTFLRPILGLWPPADLVERGNLAAALVLAGLVFGTAFAFGGALTGDDTSCMGPRASDETCRAIREFSPGETYGVGGWHVVLAYFLLAYFEMRASLTMVDRIGGGLARQARVERDTSAGLLLGAVAASAGLVAGRAAAGDFEGWGVSFADYRDRIWPILAIPFLACLVGFLTTDRPRPMLWRGVASAALVGFGLIYYLFT